METGTEKPADRALAGSLLRLLGVYVGTALLVVGGTAALAGSPTVLAALFSALVCGISAVAAHFLGVWPAGEIFRLMRLYLATAVRIGIPVIFLLICRALLPELLDQGMVYFVVLFYLVGLLTDLALQLRRIKRLESTPAPDAGPVR